jgi:hypothetical protein
MAAAIYLYVADVDEIYKRSISLGAKSVREPSDQTWGDRVGREGYLGQHLVDCDQQWCEVSHDYRIAKQTTHDAARNCALPDRDRPLLLALAAKLGLSLNSFANLSKRF